jgi:hypothetical protein
MIEMLVCWQGRFHRHSIENLEGCPFWVLCGEFGKERNSRTFDGNEILML